MGKGNPGVIDGPQWTPGCFIVTSGKFAGNCHYNKFVTAANRNPNTRLICKAKAKLGITPRYLGSKFVKTSAAGNTCGKEAMSATSKAECEQVSRILSLFKIEKEKMESQD